MGLQKYGIKYRFWMISGLWLGLLLFSNGSRVYAQGLQPQLVKDLNSTTANANPEEFTPVGNMLFFSADDGLHGRELWKTDGTLAGTKLVKDVLPGQAGSEPRTLTQFQGSLFFLANNYAASRLELWKSDGTTAGTQMLKALSDSHPISLMHVVNNILYFAVEGNAGNQVWRSDGTAQGTTLFKATYPALQNMTPSIPTLVNGALLFWENFNVPQKNNLWKIDQNGAAQIKQIPTTKPYSGEFVLNNRLLFAFADERNGYTLWQSDGTTGGTTSLLDIPNDTDAAQYTWDAYQIAQDTVLFFVRTSNSVALWKTDGTLNGTTLVKQIQPVQTASLTIDNEKFLNNKLYFTVGSVGSLGDCELWQSDGTASGTGMVKAICPNPSLTVAGNTLYFAAKGGNEGTELWKSDGTLAGTMLVKDIYPGTFESRPHLMYAAGSTVYFIAQDGVHGPELWRSDGTAAGTRLVKDVNPSPDYHPWHDFLYYFYWNGQLFLGAHDGQTGAELWKSDGTTAGTALVKDINGASNSSYPEQLTPAGNKLYFFTQATAGGRALWKTEGSLSTTILITEGWKWGESAYGIAGGVQNFYFSTRTEENVVELWMTDGTPNSVRRLVEIPPQNAYDYPIIRRMKTEGDQLFFVVESEQAGATLWKSDGDAASTRLVKRFPPPEFPSYQALEPVLIHNGLLYFSVIRAPGNGQVQYELWRSDGTEAGTSPLKNIWVDRWGKVINGTAYLFATDGGSMGGLWQTDGTPAGTKFVTAMGYPMGFINRNYLFYQYDNRYGWELWKNAGTLGAQSVLIKDINPSEDNSRSGSGPAAIFQQALYFTADDGTNGYQLWKSNGTAAGTTLVKVLAGEASVSWLPVVATSNQVYYFHENRNTTRELWASDGTGAGTRLVMNLNDDFSSKLYGYDVQMIVLQDRLYFTGNNGQTGIELWTIGNSSATAEASADAYTTDEDSTLRVAAPGVLSNDRGSGPLTTSLATLPRYGQAQIYADGSFVYAPLPDYNGTDTLTYVVRDSHQSTAVATILINVKSINDAPVAITDNMTTSRDSALLISVLNNDQDVDGNPLRISAVTQPAHGVVTIVTGQVLYTPTLGYVGNDTFTYTIRDDQGSESTGTVNVLVTQAIPTVTADYYTTAEDQTLVVAQPGVLTNDSSTSLVVMIQNAPLHGVLQAQPNGSFSYYPTLNFHGADHFSYAASDGTSSPVIATVAISVTPVNDTPIAGDDTVTTTQAIPILIPVLSNDQDVDGDPLTITALTQPVKGSSSILANQVSYTPAPDFAGEDSFTYSISDGQGGVSVGSLTVLVSESGSDPNRQSILATPDVYTTTEDTPLLIAAPGLLANDRGSGALSAALEAAPLHGVAMVSEAGGLVYTPTLNFYGVATLLYTLRDSSPNPVSATVSINVIPVNDAPTAADDDATTTQDTPVPISVLRNDQDIDGHPLTLTSLTQPAHGNAAIVANQIQYTPTAGYEGSDSFTYTISDGQGGTSQAAVTVVVAGTDAEHDGLADAVECSTTPCVDSDGDGHTNGSDIDSDGDGIPDAIESQPTYQVESAAIGAAPIDTDGDQTPDHLDTDSDNDTIPDAVEGHDANNDGQADLTPFNRDSDNDGLDDAYDTVAAPAANNARGANVTLTDLDQDQKRNWQDADDDGDTLDTAQEGSGDADKDGIPDYLDRVAGGSGRGVYLPVIRK